MRTAAKIDRNQQEIVSALREAGCSVMSLASVGKGCPDLLCGVRGQQFLIEVKPPGNADRFTDAQKKFHAEWRGSIFTVTSVEGALKAVGIRRHEPNWNRSTG